MDLIFLAIAVVLIAVIVFLIKKIFKLRARIDSLRFDKSSQAVRYGKMTEQFIPFTEQFPFPPERFRFLGSPIDGIAFDEDEIIFCEFKTAGSTLSERQRKIKELVERKKVKWEEFNLR
ncbi:MAG: Holliday junction resolvase-like protein [Candidatus Diapherotrites archaeon]|nr:Holliday junction resolvase-like protein [Candidatus Diapherotrites archaeon]